MYSEKDGVALLGKECRKVILRVDKVMGHLLKYGA